MFYLYKVNVDNFLQKTSHLQEMLYTTYSLILIKCRGIVKEKDNPNIKEESELSWYQRDVFESLAEEERTLANLENLVKMPGLVIINVLYF